MKQLSKRLSVLFFAALITGSSVLAVEDIAVEEMPKEKQSFEVMNKNSLDMPTISEEEISTDEFVVPNAPTLKPTNIITMRAIGLGVAPASIKSKPQAIALAKRSAIVDAYRQLGEKLHGLQIEAKDKIQNMVIQSSIVRTKLRSIVRGAEVVETMYSDGLCQVEMEVKIDGRRWYKVLASAQ